MANTAEVIKFPVPESAQQESRMADLDNGYLRLANQIQDALCVVELSGREFRVLNAIVRLTYGWSKKEDRIANSLIADRTRLAVKHVSEAVLNLAYRNIIKIRRIGQTRYIGINTCLDKWAYTKPKCGKCPVSFSPPEIVTQVITIPENRDSLKVIKPIPENGDMRSFQGHTRDTDNGQFFPKPADLLRHIEGNKDGKALLAWSKAYKAICSYSVTINAASPCVALRDGFIVASLVRWQKKPSLFYRAFDCESSIKQRLH